MLESEWWIHDRVKHGAVKLHSLSRESDLVLTNTGGDFFVPPAWSAQPAHKLGRLSTIRKRACGARAYITIIINLIDLTYKTYLIYALYLID